MKCELKDTFKFDSKYCLTLLPERVMFQQFGLTPSMAIKAAQEYFAGAGYIYFGNIHRDGTKLRHKIKGWAGKQAAKPFMHSKVRRSVIDSNKNIGIYEVNQADLAEYIAMVNDCGRNLYSSIVKTKGGNAERAGDFGGILASLTSLEDMISNRNFDLENKRYNPLKTEGDLERAKEMFEDYRARAISMMGEALSNENLRQETLLSQTKSAAGYIWQTRGRSVLPLIASLPLSMGCACEDIAKYKPFGENAGITCGGLAVLLVILYCCCSGNGGSSEE